MGAYTDVCLPRAPGCAVGGQDRAVAAAPEERKAKAEIPCGREEQLSRRWKQAEKNVERKTGRYTEVLRPHGPLV